MKKLRCIGCGEPSTQSLGAETSYDLSLLLEPVGVTTTKKSVFLCDLCAMRVEVPPHRLTEPPRVFDTRACPKCGAPDGITLFDSPDAMFGFGVAVCSQCRARVEHLMPSDDDN
jgi:transcription elongation factor Elf1